jgi:hypothetical protein
MSDALSQIQATYQPVEDRILLNLKTHNQQVYSAWITRRYLTLLIPALQGRHPQSGDPLFREPLKHFEDVEGAEVAAEGSESAGGPAWDSEESLEYPLGKEPILLSRITFKGLDTEEPQLHLDPEEGPGIGVPFEPKLLTLLWSLFGKALQEADWQLALEPILQLPAQTRLQ